MGVIDKFVLFCTNNSLLLVLSKERVYLQGKPCESSEKDLSCVYINSFVANSSASGLTPVSALDSMALSLIMQFYR